VNGLTAALLCAKIISDCTMSLRRSSRLLILLAGKDAWIENHGMEQCAAAS